MNGFRERTLEPPEPLCPRCGKICWPDELEHFCPDCGDAITEPSCPCGWSGEWDNAKSKCPHCGFDGSKDICVVCKKPIPPSSANYGHSICESCEAEGHRRDYEDGQCAEIEDEEIEYYEQLDKATEMECYAIEQGATTEKDMDAFTGGDAS